MELNTVRRLTIETTSRGTKEATADLRQLSSAQQGVAVTSDKTTKATLSLDAALERSRRSLDAEYRATARARQETELWTRALRTGQIALSEHSTRLSQIQARYETVGVAAARASRMGMGLGAFAGGLGGGLIGGASTIGLSMIVGKAREAVTAVDDLGDAAERAGVSGARLQTLRQALELNAGSADDADAAFSRLNKTLGDVATGRNAAASKVFQQLGIDIRDAGGNVRDTGLVFDDIADKIAKVGSVQEDASRASVLFGKEAGPGLAALLQQGAAGVQKYSQDIATYSEETLRQADALDKKLKALTQSWTVMWNTAAIKAGTFLTTDPGAGQLSAAMEAARESSATRLFEQRRDALTNSQLTVADMEAQLARSKAAGVDSRTTQAMESRLRQARTDAEMYRQQIYGYDPLSSVGRSAPSAVGGTAAAVSSMMGGAPSSGAHGPGWTSGAEIYNEKAAAQERLTKATRDYTPVRHQATAADDAATAAQQRYQDTVDATISTMDQVRTSFKSLLDVALHGGNVLAALGEQLLDLGSTGITTALFGAQGTGAGGLLGSALSKIGLGAPAAPMSLAADAVGGLPWASWLGGGKTPSSAMGGAPVGTAAAMGGPPGAAAWQPFIDASAALFHVDPNVMTTVGKGEALGSSWQSQYVKNGVRETSFGPFQLNTAPGAVGSVFQKQTGLDLTNPALFKDPANMKIYTDFVAQWASKHGWGDWMGAAAKGIGNWQGIGGAGSIMSAADWASVLSPLEGWTFHSGGIVGGAGPSRMMPGAIFANAPRMHIGGSLAHDEKPAILQVGERVLNRAETADYDRRRSGFVYAPVNHIDARGSGISRSEFHSVLDDRDKRNRDDLKRNFGDIERSYNLLKG